MLKWFWFQLHWLLGITAGTVLCVVGVTGGMLSFEDEILRLLNPGVMTVAPREGGPLAPDQLYQRVTANNPGKTITALRIAADHEESATVTFAPPPGAAGQGGRAPRGENRYADPYTGELLGQPVGQEVFRTAMQLHRWLLAGDFGKQVVGASTIALIVLSLSGLYLRWPRRLSSPRVWLTLDWTQKGRSFLWSLHAVLGTWALLFYVLASLTGLYWSYDWYRDGLFTLTGAPRPAAQGGAPTGGPPATSPQAGNGQTGGAQADATQPGGRPGGGEGQSRTRGEAGRNGGEGRTGGQATAPFVPDVAAMWRAFEHEVPGGYLSATLRLPRGPGQPVQITYLDADPAHPRASNTLTLDGTTLAASAHNRYDALPAGQKLMRSVFVLHSGEYFGKPGLILMMIASLGMPLFAVTGWMLYLDRRRKKRAAKQAAGALAGAANAPANGEGAVLVAYASQTGAAERLAWQTAAALQAAGIAVTVKPLAKLDAAALAAHAARPGARALFVASTYGEGEAPDATRAFARKVMGGTAALAGLRVAVLALGDSKYPRYCGFGLELERWLLAQGAERLFPTVCADELAAPALAEWQANLGLLGGTVAAVPAFWAAPAYDRWRLVERHLLNHNSSGLPTYHLELEPPEGHDLHWVAGDIAEIKACNAPDRVAAFLAAVRLDGATPVTGEDGTEPLSARLARSLLPPADTVAGQTAQQLADGLQELPRRDYSIASLPQDGRLHLLVRQARLPDGSLGLGSGWLTEHLELGGALDLRLRSNPSFHPQADDRPLILIGNGTGLAGLRAHLRARRQQGHRRNWLIFGERTAQHDYYYRQEIEGLRQDGFLEQLDLAFSRDGAERAYVQDRLRQAGETLREWLASGAAVYVCGSRQGMAPAVEEVLREMVGAATLDRLAEEGLYCRDVY
ncbi:sulfite reductase flavoprotein subunit alpha [Azospirillum doebereinerae]|uniref:PepSY domain-containing protein n=2 Tax=Azospirillum doebereinerae TaxID=92933 RepID=UPI001EE5A141|nr:sulfite reductase flavoprotein subunit alpha [Azospirillum doebereinerae]MCG5240577.1 sulfite reductase flavoprotein subunit alpha [Azospirillum doebereinerae]